MSWEALVGVILGNLGGTWLAIRFYRYRPYTPRSRREWRPRVWQRAYALALMRTATAVARRVDDPTLALVAFLEQDKLVDLTPRRDRFDRWHAEMVREVLRRRSRNLDRRMFGGPR